MEKITEILLARINENDDSLTTVKVPSEKADDNFMKRFGEAMEKNTIVTELIFKHSTDTRPGFTLAGISALCRSLIKNSTLLYLNFRGNTDSTNRYHPRSDWDSWLNELAFLIEKNNSITSIDLSYNMISAIGIKPIAEALKFNRGLKFLNLTFNAEMGEAGGSLLAESLKSNKMLEQLNLKECNVKDEGASALANALTINDTLLALNLFGNGIRDSGGMALSNMLLKNSSLIWLDINKYYSQQTTYDDHFSNYFSDTVMESFIKNLSCNFSLEGLSIRYTNESFFTNNYLLNDPNRTGVNERFVRLNKSLERNATSRKSVFLAAETGSFDNLKLLLNNGASFKYAREDGMTPLHLACQNGHDAVAKFLIQRGAKVFIKNKENQTPIDLAKSNGHIALALDLLTLSSSNTTFISAPNPSAVSKSSELTKAIATYREAKTQKLQKNYATALTLFGICKDNFKLSQEYNSGGTDKIFIDSKLVKIKKHATECNNILQVITP